MSIGFGYGSGWGHRSHYNGYYGMNFYPVRTTTKVNVLPFQLDAFGTKTRMNCSGKYNRAQRDGTMICTLSNGMKYKGHLKKIIVPIK